MKYETVIGLEVHAQLKTKSKIFCGCSTEFGGTPNDHVCPVCLGMPGVLPVLNKRAVEFAIKTGVALNCHISEVSRFDRKNYFYPDLPKDYQISQYDQPICVGGSLSVNEKAVRILRAHLEEDAGKLVHSGAAGLYGSDYSLVDYNRTGVPLLEIVSEPDMETPEEAKLYLTELRNILRYLDVCDGNLEEGSFRCDANISLRPQGQKELGTKVEIKNLNSFRAVQRALQSEIERQTKALDAGERIIQETRLWNDSTGQTHPMRSKEGAHDYRYFPEPDLVPLAIDRAWIEEIKKTLPELPQARRKRYLEQDGLALDEADTLVETMELSDFYEGTVKAGAQPKQAANWIVGPVIAYLKENKLELSQTKISVQNMKDLTDAIVQGILSSTTGKQLLLELLQNGGNATDIIKQKGLAQISDEAGLKDILAKILSDNSAQVEEYRQGRTKVRQFFLGEAMKATKGKANPQVINKLLDELLAQP